MSQDTAKLIFELIMGPAVALWVISLLSVLRLGAAPRSQHEKFDIAEPTELATESGQVTVRGHVPEVTLALERALRQPGLGMQGVRYRAVEKREGYLQVEKQGALVCNQPAGLYFSEATFRLTPASAGQVRVEYRIGYSKLVELYRRIALRLAFGVGLPLLVIVGGLVWLLVVNSNAPAVRWQVFQTLQVVHGLWPPFLFLWLFSIGRRQSKIYLESLISLLDAADVSRQATPVVGR